ncbi:MAG: hypothetical protein WB815_00915 [Nitrososphaeraceae archaeon]
MTNHVSSIMITVAIVVVLSTICFSFDRSDISRFAVAQNSSNTLIDLNGRWAAGDNHSAVISRSTTNLTIDMSAFDRPSAYGSILNDSTIAIIFPDDESYNGKLVPPDKIEWSNNSTWKKE